MGWTPVDLRGRRKPVVLGLGPYRRPAVHMRADQTTDALFRQWRSTPAESVWYFTLAAIFWSGISTAMIVSMLRLQSIGVNDHSHSSFSQALGHDPWIGIFVVFPLLGIVHGYIAVAKWVNHTRIDLLSSCVIIRCGPLPWRGRFVAIAVSTIKQLCVQQYVGHDENDHLPSAFRVVARLKDGRDIPIDHGMSAYSDARVLEQWIEQRLDGPDRR